MREDCKLITNVEKEIQNFLVETKDSLKDLTIMEGFKVCKCMCGSMTIRQSKRVLCDEKTNG